MKNKKLLVIGSGPAGATISRILAESNWNVHIFEKRNHIGGNLYDYKDKNGVLIHRYGPHYFRTNNFNLIKWLSRFTKWHPGNYYVKAKVFNDFVPLPISLSTISAIKGEVYNEDRFKAYLDKNRIIFNRPQNAEEQCLSVVGSELYELLFKGYTIKQWGLDPSELDPSITARIPLRFNWDEKYVNSEYQVMPQNGYAFMMQNILDHNNISININHKLDYSTLQRMLIDYTAIIYTGPIDEYFNYKYGSLDYRSLKFRFKNYKTNYKQPCVQINYPNDKNYTRSVEIKHVTKQQINNTTISYEYPVDNGEPFYPIINPKNLEKLKKYQKIVSKNITKKNPTYFIGRLAEFRYYDMDQVFLKAISLSNKILKRFE